MLQSEEQAMADNSEGVPHSLAIFASNAKPNSGNNQTHGSEKGRGSNGSNRGKDRGERYNNNNNGGSLGYSPHQNYSSHPNCYRNHNQSS